MSVKNELTRFSSSILALMIEYIATPAMAIPVPIPVCVDILFPANIDLSKNIRIVSFMIV